MKRLIMMSLALLLLSACGRNENISEGMMKDTEQIFTLIETSIEEDRESTIEEWDILNEYKIRYTGMKEDEELSDDERVLKARVDLILTLHDPGFELDSVNDKVVVKIDEAKYFMRTGELE